MLKADEAGQPITVVEAVAELVDTGSPKLSDEAAEWLDTQPAERGGRVPGPKGDMSVGRVEWRPDGLGCRTLTKGPSSVEFVDYKDQLNINLLDPELGQALNLASGELESRQCIILATVAAVEWARMGTLPSADEVNAKAVLARRQMWEQACTAATCMEEMPMVMLQGEADARLYAHDCINPDHDKHVRTLALYPPLILDGVSLHV